MRSCTMGHIPVALACLLVSLSLAVAVLTASAQGVGEPLEEPKATVEYPRNPQNVVVSLSQSLGEIGHADRGPSLRIYGDRRAVVHYPPYMKRAGDYTLQLSQSEMDGLLLSLTSKGIVEFDEAAVHRRKHEETERRRVAAAKEGTEPELVSVSDASTTTIEVRLDRYRPAGARGDGFLNVKKRISWRGLKSDARQYPSIQAIQNLAAAEQELLGLMKRPDLVRGD